MKQTSIRFAGLVFVAFLTVAVSFGQGTTITLLHMNDTHSHLDAYGPKDQFLKGTIGGIARAASVIGMTQATEPNVMVLHAGDLLVGDLFFNTYFGVPEIQLLKSLNIDAMTVGNHEFEFGPVELKGILEAGFANGSFPLLGANLDFTGYPDLDPFVQPSIIKEYGTTKVGVFGLTIPGNPTTNSGPVVIRDDLVDLAVQQIGELRAQGAKVVVLLSHLGIYLDRILAANIPGIDVIIGGHDHFAFAQPEVVNNPYGGRTWICQAGAMYQNIGKLVLNVDGDAVSMVGYQLIPLDVMVPAEPTIQGIVDELKLGIVAQYGDVYTNVVATAQGDLDETYDARCAFRDTPLGNLVTDSYRWKTHTTLGITALGIIAEKIYAGPIVAADVFRAVSYGFDPATGLGLKLATATIKGSELIKGLELGLSQLEVTDDYFIQVSGMSFMYDARKPVGERVLIPSVRIDGKPLQPNKKYSVTTNEGILAVLGPMGVEMEKINVLPDYEYIVLKDYFAHLRRIRPTWQGRIMDASLLPWIAKRDEVGAIIKKILSHFCYPNPFNPSTTITFELPAAAHVSLKVFNMLGQEVATLAQGELSAGTHSRTFDASRLTSGVYFYRLESGSQVLTDKLVLLK